MTDVRHQRAKELFLDACDREVGERAAFLEVACAGDADLRAEIEELLAIDSEEDSFLETPILQAPGDLLEALASDEGALEELLHVPHYRVLRKLGEGGMGTVFEAEQENPRRIVALKVLQPAMCSKSMLRRFEFEGHLLGRLQHPGIAQIFEAGLADGPGGSRPYLAMELVRGSQLTEHARDRALGIADRARLIAEVCDAVEHAHQKGIIHRDLKPSNILVTDEGQPKVLDFGVARAVDVEPDAEHTLVGQVIGTLAYMSPEQAFGDPRAIDTRSDVYSLGVVLYELLCERLPYEVSHCSLTEAARVITEQKPERLGAVSPRLKGDLETITGKALEKDRDQRYASVAALAADLRRYLRDEPIEALSPSGIYRLRKLVRRNRGLSIALCAAVLALVGGLVTSLILMDRSNRNAVRAADNEARALESEGIALARADDVMRLSALQDLDDLIAEADLLWPAQPSMVPRYETWVDRARRQVDELPAHEARLAAVREKAVPRTAEEAAAERATHPKLAELEASRRKLENQRRLFAALASPRPRPVRETAVEVGAPARDPTVAGTEPNDVNVDPRSSRATEFNDRAWPLIDPARAILGSEEEGLALVRKAVELVAPLAPCEQASKYDTLAWALFANGRYEEALAAEEQALALVEQQRAPLFERYLAELEKWVEAAIGADREEQQRALQDELEARVAALELEVATSSTWRFTDTQDKWWHNQLTKLVDGLKAFADPETGLLSSGITRDHGWGIGRRLEFARTVEERSITGAEASALWAEAIASIRDEAQCRMYAGLVLEPQLGLLPIGRDPESGLWEFAHLETGVPAERGLDGTLMLREEMGLVLVLLPGGAFSMGAQRDDPALPNFDPGAWDEEGPVHEVVLSPFFLSKYEMTQSQWGRWTGEYPSNHCASNQSIDWSVSRTGWNELYPVERVSWIECDAELARSDLVLPTEAQWEYACRAGTDTVYWSGDAKESLAGVDNFADAYGKRNRMAGWSVWEQWLDDGRSESAEIGSYRGNPFGLHDLHGNLMEWCRDWFVAYGTELRPGDGESLAVGHNRVLRGGCFQGETIIGRSASREDVRPGDSSPSLGLRPARAVSQR